MGGTTQRPVRAITPSLRVERANLRDGSRWIAGMDEVGRGSLAGPVSVGVVLVDLSVSTAPPGLRDSKLLLPAVRTRLAPRLRRWACGWGVGHATAAEIDAVGIMGALCLAGRRALAQLPARPDVVLLDGSYDWLTLAVPPVADLPDAGYGGMVQTKVKADLYCASVAAASVLAKTTRDALMVGLSDHHPQYGWHLNKGYASPAHRAALREHGPTLEHRRSWHLLDDEVDPRSESLGAVN